MMGGAGGASTNLAAISHLTDVRGLILVGDAAVLEAHPSVSNLVHQGARVEHTPDWLTGAESLSEVLRHRPDASMAVCARLVKSRQADAMVSSGDTRALMALSRRYLGTLPGLQRPAITKAFNGEQGTFWMLDLGANIDCSARVLLQFAKLGKTIASLSDGRDSANRVALLNIGTEQGKGPQILNEAAELIRNELGDVEFVGFVEPNELFEGRADLIVCDGFVGNLLLKTLEGTAMHLGRTIQKGLLGGSWLTKLGVSLARPDIEAIRDELDPQNYNGALLAGIRDGVVVKSHGSTGALGFRNAIQQTRVYLDADLTTKLAIALSEGGATV
jgi:glycerol-3-phosphate acyltransferase PlsX